MRNAKVGRLAGGCGDLGAGPTVTAARSGTEHIGSCNGCSAIDAPELYIVEARSMSVRFCPACAEKLMTGLQGEFRRLREAK